jgi:hypothetical protein
MKQPYYDFQASTSQLFFTFDSIGPNGIIPKAVVYSPLYNMADIYNLAFGDMISDEDFDDEVISNNNDRDKVLATVIQTMLVFFETYPNKIVFLTGSTPSRTRLYQIIINREYYTVSEVFEIEGVKNNTREKIVQNKRYDAFLIKLKTIT